ncbi:YveK family protein [Nocardia coubleae]|uniref:Capsular polysaccharide biosynthesis protein n=1 Tax=Nocardia coubleae TaxID=356147 RepID=A0A846W416_9NOCA|nr:hypothetical protein [Nocardia coubleae]NKX87510.1 hypothetical protein [Nocardia coubleae]
MTLLRWWPSVAGVVLGCTAAVGMLVSSPTVFTATTTLFIGSPVSADSAGAYAGDLFGQQRAVSYAHLFTSDDLATKVIDDLSLELTPAELIAQVSARQLPKTVLLEVNATDPAAQRAADIANAYAANFAAYVARLETPAVGNQSVAKISVVRTATAPVAPSSPGAPMYLGGGLVLGAMLGGLAQWALSRHARRAAPATDVPEPAPRRTEPPREAGTGSHRAAPAVRRTEPRNFHIDAEGPEFATQQLPRAGGRTHG